MGIKRMDNVLINVADLEKAKAFFVELGMEVEGQALVEGEWADKVVGLTGVRSDIVMMKTSDGQGKIELCMFHSPKAVDVGAGKAPSNALGIRRIMFTVDDVQDVVDRLCEKHGAELVGEIADYQDVFRLCFIRGPEGIILGLAQEL